LVGDCLLDFSPIRLDSNKGTKSDIEIAPAERALDRFSSCFFEPVVGSSRVVATSDKLLAGARTKQGVGLSLPLRCNDAPRGTDFQFLAQVTNPQVFVIAS
jgi:hypothetical protein